MSKKHKKLSYYKDKAWKAFSRWIRLRDADRFGNVRCCTCNKTFHWKESQAGHFVDGRNNTVLFDEKLVHAQCPKCNLFLKGNKIRYVLFMKKKYGYSDKQIEELDNLKFRTKKLYQSDFEEIEKEYSEKGFK